MLRDEDTADPELEALLRSARAEPSDSFVAATERRLLGRPRRERHRRRTTPGAALGLSGALAAVMLAAGVIDSGPLSLGGTDEVHGRESCRQVQVTRVQRVGELVRGADGTATVVMHKRPVTRTVTRCR